MRLRRESVAIRDEQRRSQADQGPRRVVKDRKLIREARMRVSDWILQKFAQSNGSF